MGNILFINIFTIIVVHRNKKIDLALWMSKMNMTAFPLDLDKSEIIKQSFYFVISQRSRPVHELKK